MTKPKQNNFAKLGTMTEKLAEFSSSGWHSDCYPKGGLLRHLFLVTYARITAPSVTKCLFCLETCQIEDTQSSNALPFDVKSMADIRLISEHCCDYCDADCQGKINIILNIN